MFVRIYKYGMIEGIEKAYRKIDRKERVSIPLTCFIYSCVWSL